MVMVSFTSPMLLLFCVARKVEFHLQLDSLLMAILY